MSVGPTSSHPVSRSVHATTSVAVLGPFVEAGVFGPYEVQLAATIRRLQPGVSDEVVLALALAARAPRFGHVCVGLDPTALRLVELDDDGPGSPRLPWPEADRWAEALEASPTVAAPTEAATEPVRPLVWDGHRLYLQRYWHYELAVADDLVRRSGSTAPPPGSDPMEPAPVSIEATLDVLFGPDTGDQPDLQRRAVSRGLQPGVSIIAGGPGTGKTFTVARLLAAAQLVAAAGGHELDVALAAPTGKAAARMGEAVQAGVHDLDAAGLIGPGRVEALTAIDPTTIHSLLGWRDRTRFRHDRQHPLPHDLVVVDETSMVSLPLMARLLDAVRPEARLVLVGDPFQLASIEAGTVMSDMVGRAGASGVPGHVGLTADRHQAAEDDGDDDGPGLPALAGRVTVLRRMRRFGEDSAIAALAESVRTGDVDGAMALLARHPDDVHWVSPDRPDELARISDEVFAGGVAMVSEALAGQAGAALAAANRIKVLAATRRGPLGVYEWTGRIEAAVAAALPDYTPVRRWHVGRPVMVTANDPANHVFNGDVGVVVAGDTGLAVAIGDGDDLRYLPPSRLDRVETWWAMTIHKSQGSEFVHAVVSLPDARSPILTRELLYTGVTRARERLTIVGSEEAVRAAIGRPVTRASGLRDRLWPISIPQ